MNEFVKSLLFKFQVFRDLREGRKLRGEREQGLFPLFIDYELRSTPRYGHGKAPHPELFEILNADRNKYAESLGKFLQFKCALETIPLDQPEDLSMPYWRNGFFGGLDAVTLYAFLTLNNPRLYLEIGSGNSTKFARKAIEDQHLETRIISIDPHPRAEIDRLCDAVRRERLEETDLSIFNTLAVGDILFVDGSHRAFMNSDVSVIFLEVLPRLKSGVLVYIDDIYLPFDYPPEWISRYYSEQYLLAVLLLAGGTRYEVVLPCLFVSDDAELIKILYPLSKDGPLTEVTGWGKGFWLRVC